MRVLLTNNTLANRAGTELYVRDVAIELLRRGHHPVAYSTHLGPVAEELRAATVPVIRSLDCLGEPPDIIHGHHHYDTLAAMTWFPVAPAVYFCHGWLPWEEAPLHFPRILRYVAVDELCRERLIAEGGIAADRIDLILNFFDESLFPPREPLPAWPRKALVFSNTFDEDSDLPVLRKACERCGIELHAVGIAMGNSQCRPGALLAHYDLVFAKARAAIEALAVGTAVVLCNPGRLGPMVTSENFAALRLLNFGFRSLSLPLEEDLLVAEIQRYDAADAAAVSRLVRENCELKAAVDRIVNVYERVIEEARDGPVATALECGRAVTRYLEQSAEQYKRSTLAEERLRWIQRCAAAERALAEKQTEAVKAGRELSCAKNLLAERDRQLALLRRENAEMRASATWRWTQAVLGSWPVKRMLGPFIRAIANRSQRAVALQRDAAAR